MSDEPFQEKRRSTDQLATEIDALRAQFNEHYRIDEAMHTETNEGMKTILTKVEGMTEKVESIGEIVLAWNNVKGFASVMHGLGSVAKWFIGIGAALGTIWWSLKGGSK